MAASRVACASFNLGTNTTITITRDKSNYTHTLRYYFNGASGIIAEKISATTYIWEPPTNAFYASIPHTTSGYGEITCETFNGSTSLGMASCGFYAYTSREKCAPTVSGTVVDTNAATIAVTGDSSKMVRYLSKPKATMTETAKNSAEIRTTQIENPVGLVATTSPYTFDTVYSPEFRFKATDSRGYSTTETVEVEGFVEYDPCYFEKVPVVTRTESTSTTAKATLNGFCFNGNFGIVDNTLTVKCRYKTSGGSYGSYEAIPATWNSDGTFSATATITGLSLEETYTIEFVVEDKLTSFPVEAVLGQGTGDLRIAKDYVQSRNNFVIGDENNEAFKYLKVRRKIDGVPCWANFALSNPAKIAIELYNRANGTNNMLGRLELQSDGHLYNYMSSMTFAEIMSAAPSTVNGGGQGYFLLNGGDSAAPILVQWGRVSVTPTAANATTSVAVNFSYQYRGVPFVCIDKATTAPASVFANVGDITASGFNIYLQRTTATATSILWFAIGNGSYALPV